VGAARELLREARRPFFWFVNVMEPHAPYLPPRRHLPSWGPDRLVAPSVVHRFLKDRFVLSYNLGRGALPGSAARILRKLYAGEISYTDEFLREFLEVLEPREEDTLVVVTSDHGEHLGERHRLGHQLALDDELLDVPFAARGPGAPQPGTAPVFPLNGVPKLLADGAGLARHPWSAAGDVAIAEYESGWEQIRSAPQLAGELHLSVEERAILHSPMVSATDGFTTLTVSASGERVEGDPAGLERLRSAIEAGGGARRPEGGEGVSPEEEAEIEERLRQLGYL
jgi:hypothetical protein